MSSCLFATIVVHAYSKRLAWTHHIFLALTVSSVLFHTTHDPTVRWLDKALAHLAFLVVLKDAPRVWLSRTEWWVLVFPLSTLCLWGAQCFYCDENRRKKLHLALHLLSVGGMHAYMDGLAIS